MKLSDYMAAVITDLKANATFLNDVGSHGKVFGLEEIRQLTLFAPACRIALVGARGTTPAFPGRASMGRADTGQFRGPIQMIAFLIEQDRTGPDDGRGEEARDRVIHLADDFMTFLEHRSFGLSNNDAGPALITGFDIFYSAEVDAQGAAIAAVTWEQEVFFGRSLHDEDMALLTGDKYGQYLSGQELFPEKEWADKGQLLPDVKPLVKSTARPGLGGGAPSVPENDEHEPIE